MVVDDVIAQFGLDNTALIFQPASGVEVMVTAASCANVNILLRYDDGTDFSNFATADTLATIPNFSNVKMGITNTVFLQLSAPGAGIHVAFSGIQLK